MAAPAGSPTLPWSTAALSAAVALVPQPSLTAAMGIAGLFTALIAGWTVSALVARIPDFSTAQSDGSVSAGWAARLRSLTPGVVAGGRLLRALMAAALVAPWLADLGWKGVLLVSVGWAVAGFSGSVHRLALAGLSVAGLAGLGLGIWTWATEPTVTLLEAAAPAASEPWLYAIYGGVAAAGLGASAPGGPGPRWLGLGVGAIAGLAIILRTAAGYATDAALNGDPLVPILLAVLIPLVIGGGVDLGSTGSSRRLWSVFGLATTLTLGYVAPDASSTLWTLVLPLGWATYLFAVAWLALRPRSARLGRWAAAAAGIGLLAAAAGLSASLDLSPLAAVTLAAIPVFALWVSGTIVLVRRAP